MEALYFLTKVFSPQAIVKSFTIPGPEDTKPEKFVAYMVPKPEELERDIYEDDEDISYTWVREYHWDLRTDPAQSTYVFCFSEDGVNYLPLHTKLILQKKKAREGRPKEEDPDQVQFPVPERVTVRRREFTEDELRVKEDTRVALLEVCLSFLIYSS
jgi:RNA polymerase II-associated factor 1